MCTVVNLTKEECDVYGGRTKQTKSWPLHANEVGYFGNPYSVHSRDPKFRVGSRTEAIEKHRAYAIRRYATDEEFKLNVDNLYGKRLGCFCKPKSCHCDVLAELANASRSPLF